MDVLPPSPPIPTAPNPAPWMPPPPPPPRGRPTSFWVALILFVLLAGSVVLNLALAMGTAITLGKSSEQPTYRESTLAGDAEQADKVLAIPLRGVIMEGESNDAFGSRTDPVNTVAGMLRQASKDEHVRAILLMVDSPGGGITASDVLYHDLASYRRRKNVPIVALCGDLTASGAYYASMAADHIMAHQTSMVGSIGVIAEFLNVAALMQRYGVQMNVIKSERSDGTESYKDMGSPFRPMKAAERRMMQHMVEVMWHRFVDVVASGRKGKLTHDQVAALADGRIWTAPQALQLKLIDSLGYRDDAWKKAAELGHAPNARLVTYARHETLLKTLFEGRARPSSLEDLLAQRLDPLASATPQLMYLWTAR